jgi:hypothetical protein
MDEGTLLFYRNGEISGEVYVCFFGMILGLPAVINKDFFE